MTFNSSKLKLVRVNKNLTLNKLAFISGFNIRTLWSWEKGKTYPSEKNLRKLAKALEISVAEISDLPKETPVSSVDLTQYSLGLNSFYNSDIITQRNYANQIIQLVSKQQEKLSLASIVVRGILSVKEPIFYIKTPDLKYAIVNNAFLDNINLLESFNSLGKRDIDFFAKSEALINENEDREMILKNIPNLEKEAFIPGSRKKRWGLCKKSLIYDKNGKVEGLIAFFIDLTEKKKDEEEKSILENSLAMSNIVIGILSRKRRKFLYLSDAVKRYANVSPKEWLNDPKYTINNFTYSEDKKRLLSYMEKLSYPPSYVHRFKDKDGKLLLIETITDNIMYSNEECILFVNRPLYDL